MLQPTPGHALVYICAFFGIAATESRYLFISVGDTIDIRGRDSLFPFFDAESRRLLGHAGRNAKNHRRHIRHRNECKGTYARRVHLKRY